MTEVSIKLWYGKVGLRVDNKLFRLLSPQEQAFAEQLVNPAMRSRYIYIHARLRWLLAEWLKVEADTLMIAKAEFGKPYLPDYPELQFNLSHSGDYFAIVIAEQIQVGIDLEVFKARKNYNGLAEKCFAADELNFWRSLSTEQQAEYFFRFWTCKEAFVKATGRGIAMGLKQCVYDLSAQARLEKIPAEYGRAEHWAVKELALTDGVYSALVAHVAPNQLLVTPCLCE